MSREVYHTAYSSIKEELDKEFSKEVNERDWKGTIDLTFLEPYMWGDEEIEEEDVPGLGKKVADVIDAFAESNKGYGEELDDIARDFEDAVEVDDFDYVLEDLYDFGDTNDIWIRTSEVMGEGKTENGRTSLKEKCGKKKMKKGKKVKEGKTPGKRDGTGPAGSRRKGRRKSGGQKCPFEHGMGSGGKWMKEAGDRLGGGLADLDAPGDFDEEQIKMGIEVEMEHTDDPELAREIAMDHLKEKPDYYSALRKMEAGGCDESEVNEEEIDYSKELLAQLRKQKARGETLSAEEEEMIRRLEQLEEKKDPKAKATESRQLKEQESFGRFEEIEDEDPSADRLQDILELMWELNDLALETVEAVDEGGMEVKRAKSYWFAHIQGALDKDRSSYLGGSMMDMADAVDSLRMDSMGEEEEDEVEESKQPLKEWLGDEMLRRNEALFDKLVPTQGPADTEEGELLRATNRLIYRYYNDGDYFYEGYGTETAGPAHAFLKAKGRDIPGLIDALDAADGARDKNYEEALTAVANAVMDYIEGKNGEYAKNTEDMLDYEPEYEDEEEDEDEDRWYDDWDDEDDYDDDEDDDMDEGKVPNPNEKDQNKVINDLMEDEDNNKKS